MLNLIANALLIAAGGYRPQNHADRRDRRIEKALKS